MSDPREYVVARNRGFESHDLTEEYMIAVPGTSETRWTDNPRRATRFGREMADGTIGLLEVSGDAERPYYRYHVVETGAFCPEDKITESPFPPTPSAEPVRG